jgi:hypothetical protein
LTFGLPSNPTHWRIDNIFKPSARVPAGYISTLARVAVLSVRSLSAGNSAVKVKVPAVSGFQP